MGRVASGLEIFLRDPPPWVEGARLGLLSHAQRWAGPGQRRELVAHRFPGRLTVLLNPSMVSWGRNRTI